MAVPTAKVFFEEVRGAFAEVAEKLGLEGPTEVDRPYGLPIAEATYTHGGLEYEAFLEQWEGYVTIKVQLKTDTHSLSADIEPLAIAAGIVEKRGGVSFSARGLKQMRKSLAGQLAYVELVHPLLTGDADSAAELLRKTSRG